MNRFVAVLASAITAVTAVSTGLSAAAPVESLEKVIVVVSPASDHAAVAVAHRNSGVRVEKVYRSIHAYVADVTPSQRASLANDRRVVTVAPDIRVHASSVQSPAPWPLDRIDQRDLPLNGSYNYATDGSTVKAYILDTGVRSDHVELAGRVAPGFDAVAGNSSEDCHGHGTHVAGSVGAATYGVAKGVSIVPVRVLGCDGSGYLSGILAGVDWVTADHAAGTPAVANLSLGGSANSTLDSAVDTLVADGISVAVAAGNSGVDACTASPARARAAITVAATSSSDARPSWSNYGSCVDVFAPGEKVESLAWASSTATTTMSGTSMAAPHVAGAAALYLTANPSASPAAVHDAVVANATTGVVTGPGTGSPNLLVSTLAPPPAAPAPAPTTAPGSPTGVAATTADRKANVSWKPGPDGGSPVTSYTVRAHSGTTVVKTVTVSGSSTAVTVALKRGSYSFTVQATNATGTSPWSAPSNTVSIR